MVQRFIVVLVVIVSLVAAQPGGSVAVERNHEMAAPKTTDWLTRGLAIAGFGLSVIGILLTYVKYRWDQHTFHELREEREQDRKQRHSEREQDRQQRQREREEDRREKQEATRERVTVTLNCSVTAYGPTFSAKVYNPCDFIIPIRAVELRAVLPDTPLPNLPNAIPVPGSSVLTLTLIPEQGKSASGLDLDRRTEATFLLQPPRVEMAKAIAQNPPERVSLVVCSHGGEIATLSGEEIFPHLMSYFTILYPPNQPSDPPTKPPPDSSSGGVLHE